MMGRTPPKQYGASGRRRSLRAHIERDREDLGGGGDDGDDRASVKSDVSGKSAASGKSEGSGRSTVSGISCRSASSLVTARRGASGSKSTVKARLSSTLDLGSGIDGIPGTPNKRRMSVAGDYDYGSSSPATGPFTSNVTLPRSPTPLRPADANGSATRSTGGSAGAKHRSARSPGLSPKEHTPGSVGEDTTDGIVWPASKEFSVGEMLDLDVEDQSVFAEMTPVWRTWGPRVHQCCFIVTRTQVMNTGLDKSTAMWMNDLLSVPLHQVGKAAVLEQMALFRFIVNSALVDTYQGIRINPDGTMFIKMGERFITRACKVFNEWKEAFFVPPSITTPATESAKLQTVKLDDLSFSTASSHRSAISNRSKRSSANEKRRRLSKKQSKAKGFVDSFSHVHPR